MTDWRLIIDRVHDGATNMATDEAIMEAVAAGQVPPTLRLYAWDPPCLSLGHNQAVADVDVERLKARGWGIVRRPTGGKSILHTDELTYSVTIPDDSPIVAGGVIESYRRLSQALMRALIHLGLHPESLPQEKDIHGGGPVCFQVPSHYEITVNEHKLIGSAQVRRRGVVLQHGTLPLYGDISRICDVLHFEDETIRQRAKSKVHDHAITLETAAGQIISWDDAANAVIAAFAESFSISLQEHRLSPAETERLFIIKKETYTNDAWTYRH